MIFYFSATGNCEYVATRLAEATVDTPVSITECLRRGQRHFQVGKDEQIGFVTPVYFLGLPSIVVDFMSHMDISPRAGQYLYHVLTYGTTTGQAHKMMDRLLWEKGLSLHARYTVKMVDTWTPVFDLTDTAKNAAILKRAEPLIDRVAGQINAGARGDFDRHKLPFGGLYYATYPWQSQTKRFTVADSCIGCGLCQRQCPSSAIELEDGRPRWVKPHCAICLGCLHRCPKFSIQYGRKTGGHGQYVNPHARPSMADREVM